MPLSVALDATPLLGVRTGVGMFCRYALEGLARRPDLEVSAFAVTWRRRDQLGTLLPPGVGARQRPMPARPLLRAWRSAETPAIERFVGRHDVVHGTNFVVPPARHAARVVTVHDLTAVRYPHLVDRASLGFPEMVRRAVRHGAWVHTPSRFVAEEVVSELGVPPERVRAVHHGVPTVVELPGRDLLATGELRGRDLAATGGGEPGHAVAAGEVGAEPGAGEAKLQLPVGTSRYVLVVGTVEPRKDLPGLVRAFEQVAAGDRSLALVIAGADGWGSEALEAALAGSASRDRVLRVGYLDGDGLRSIMAGAAVLAFPSLYEGFGFPPLEAMSAGVPVVATTAGAVPEVVGEAGVLVTPGDTDALAAALSLVLSDDSLVAGLVERGRRRVASFTWDACAAGLEALYRDASAQQ